MIINGKSLLLTAPIKNMIETKERAHGVSYGLGEAGYDIRIKQTIEFRRNGDPNLGPRAYIDDVPVSGTNFSIASAIEEFDMPHHLAGIVHDKSTWARRGLSVFNTVIEPGWKGFLTLELVYHGAGSLLIPAGAGIAQVIFHQVSDVASYEGKYNNAGNFPQPALGN